MPSSTTDFLGKAILIVAIIVTVIIIGNNWIRDSVAPFLGISNSKNNEISSKDKLIIDLLSETTKKINYGFENQETVKINENSILDNSIIIYGIFIEEENKECDLNYSYIILKGNKKSLFPFPQDDFCFYLNDEKIIKINNKDYEIIHLEKNLKYLFYDPILLETKTKDYLDEYKYKEIQVQYFYPEVFNCNYFKAKEKPLFCITFIPESNKEYYPLNKIEDRSNKNNICIREYENISIMYKDKTPDIYGKNTCINPLESMTEIQI